MSPKSPGTECGSTLGAWELTRALVASSAVLLLAVRTMSLKTPEKIKKSSLKFRFLIVLCDSKLDMSCCYNGLLNFFLATRYAVQVSPA